MARVDNDTRQTALALLREIQNHINRINLFLKEEANLEGKLDATYVSGRNAAAIAEGAEILKKFRWFWEDANQLNQTVLPAYTDAEIDAINENIRTHDDGT
jgi:hypothetical protein